VEAGSATTEADKNELNASNSLIADNGASVSITLPDGNVLNIAKNSPEFKLFSFLNSPDAAVEPDETQGWITLDKVTFENEKTKLAPEAENRLNNVAQIMQFFPNSRIKVGGYTDNTGTDAVNKQISTERAKVAAEKIISSGIEANRVSYEGYASQRPVCPPNDSEDCRAANRRIDIKVMQK
jgi:outer membrane protein OmpA-like peptidoglycan-associated protein